MNILRQCNPFQTWHDVVQPELMDEDRPLFVENSLGERFLNIADLRGGFVYNIVIYPFNLAFQTTKKIVQLLTFRNFFWNPDLQGAPLSKRCIATGKDICKVLCAPIFLISMLFINIFGLFSPQNGRRLWNKLSTLYDDQPKIVGQAEFLQNLKTLKALNGRGCPANKKERTLLTKFCPPMRLYLLPIEETEAPPKVNQLPVSAQILTAEWNGNEAIPFFLAFFAGYKVSYE